ncbi:hypothetical protein SVIOM342S_05979 [Streptomyces violaceorubidus]
MGIVGQPLLFVLLGEVLILFSLGYAEMSRHVHNAGAFYAYISRGLGGTAGAGAALVALVAYNALQVGIYGIFGFEVSGLLSTYADIDVAWWIPALLAVLAVGALGWLKIDVNARVLGVLLLIEVALVVAFDIAAAADPGAQGLSLHAFNPDDPRPAPGSAPRSASASPPSSASSRRRCTPRRPRRAATCWSPRVIFLGGRRGRRLPPRVSSWALTVARRGTAARPPGPRYGPSGQPECGRAPRR